MLKWEQPRVNRQYLEGWVYKMAVGQKSYSKRLEAGLAAGKPFDRAHADALKKRKKREEEALLKKVGRHLKMIYYGKKYHSKTKKKKNNPKKGKY